jgi:hypothetical protein
MRSTYKRRFAGVPFKMPRSTEARAAVSSSYWKAKKKRAEEILRKR